MIDDARSNKLRKFLCFLVPLVYVAAMLPSVAGKLFPVDDPSEMDFVRGVPPLRLFTGQDAFGYFRPVKNLLWLLFSGLAPLGVEWFHVVAIAFGVLSFFPVLAFCRRISGSGWKALAAASVWLLSPTLVSSAAWLSCLNVQVMVSFAALSFVFHDKAWDGGSFRPSRVVLAGGFLFLALVSYECAIAVVPILLLFDFILRPGRLAVARARTAHATYWAVATVYLVLRTVASSRTGTQGLWAQADRWQLVVSSPWFTVQHFSSWFCPFGRFTVLGGYRWGDISFRMLALCSAIGLLALAGAVLLRRKTPALSFCILFSVVSFAPVSNCLGTGNGPYGDYYLTLASVGLAAGCVEIASLLSEIRGKYRIAGWSVVFLFVLTRIAAAAESARWARLWSDGIAAHEESCRNFPDWVSNKVFVLGTLSNEGRFREALDLCEIIEKELSPESPMMSQVLRIRAIYALNVDKNAEKAFTLLNQCALLAKTEVDSKLVHYYRGCAFEDLTGDEQSAESEYGEALQGRWGVDLVPCADRFARLKAIRGERHEAIALWERALVLAPNNVPVLWNLSVACAQEGQNGRCAELRAKVRRLTAADNNGNAERSP